MDLKLLREATRPEHEATEAAVPLTGASLTREQYIAVLRRFHTFICAWDSFAQKAAPEPWRELVQARRRCGSLDADLQFLGAPTESGADAGLDGPDAGLEEQMRAIVGEADGTAERDARFLGLMYVVEGSTLGGQYIAKQVEEQLGLRKGEGDSFFRGYGDQTMPRWREFQQVLRDVPDSLEEVMIQAAKSMFHLVGSVMQRA